VFDPRAHVLVHRVVEGFVHALIGGIEVVRKLPGEFESEHGPLTIVGRSPDPLVDREDLIREGSLVKLSAIPAKFTFGCHVPRSPVYQTNMDLSPQNLSVLNTIRDAVAANADAKGFRDQMKKDLTEEQWKGPLGQLVRAAVYTANQHGEASEFWEAFRKGKLDEPCDKAEKMVAMGLPSLTNAEEEIADEIIRALDKAQAHGVDVAKAVAVKHAYNTGRPMLHGGKLA